MENRIQQLTEKLYNEGVSKGKAESEQLISQAKIQSDKIIADANSRAEDIVAAAKKEAQEFAKNTKNEVVLASKEIVADVKAAIQNVIMAKTVSEDIKSSFSDSSFVKDLIIESIRAWGAKSAVSVIVPADKQDDVKKYIASKTDAVMNQGIDVVVGDSVKSGFRIAPKDQGYYINFSSDDFDRLFKEYLRSKVSETLYGGE